jgi:hypothetical protein
MKKILIVTDAWRPQINGVVRSLERLSEELIKVGVDVDMLTPQEFTTLSDLSGDPARAYDEGSHRPAY